MWHSYYDHQCNFQCISGPSYIDIHNFESKKQYLAAENQKKSNVEDIRYYSYYVKFQIDGGTVRSLATTIILVFLESS